ncbi:hypothetical protein KCU62_g6027, partial [Aureobasidium sp. EXF-3399]
MDVAGTAVGIASLGIQVCQGLLSYYDAWKSYHPDISSTYEAIIDLSKTLTVLKTTLQQQADGERVERVRTCVKGCEDALRQLDEKRRSLQKFTAPEGFRQTVRSGLQRSWYPFRKETLEALKTNVTNVQERLKLTLQVLQLEIGTESYEMALRLLDQTTAQTNSMAQITAQNQRILDVQGSDEFRKIIAWLGSPDPMTNHATARQRHESQTGTWLLKSSQYQSWKTGAVSHLWLYGKAGCGKTILCSTAIEDIRNTCEQDTDTCYAFFYFSFSDNRKQSDGDLLRSLVAQLGWREPGLSMLRQAYEDSRRSPPGPAELELILLASIRSCKTVFLLVDALDECPVDDETRQGVLQRIGKLAQDSSNLKILATSREQDRIRKALQAMTFKPVSVATRDVDADIRIYLSNQLLSDSSLRELNPEMRTLIENSRAAKADGMFRWAYCQLQELKNLESYKPKYVKFVLESLPPTLDDMYTRILTRIKKMYHTEAVTLLHWLAYARSPPTLGELVDAAIIDPAKENSIDTSERGRLRDALNILSGLVMVDSSVSGGSALSPYTKTIGFASSIRKLVRGLLERGEVVDSRGGAFGNPLQAAAFNGHIEVVRILLKTGADSGADINEECGIFGSALQAASYGGHNEVVRLLLESRADVKSLNGRYGSALQAASARGHTTTVRLLLENGAYTNSRGGFAGSALYAASGGGFAEILKLLLAHGSQAKNDEVDFANALRKASYLGHVEFVQLLLESGANPNSPTYNRTRSFALEAACLEGHTQIVQALLDYGANTNTTGGVYDSALETACSQGHAQVVQMLLDHEANVNTRSGSYDNALAVASCGGYKAVVQLLLREGADANYKGGYYGSPLQAAARFGHTDIMQILIDEGADINARSRKFSSAIQAASSNGQTRAVQLLLDAGAIAGAQSIPYDIARFLVRREDD